MSKEGDVIIGTGKVRKEEITDVVTNGSDTDDEDIRNVMEAGPAFNAAGRAAAKLSSQRQHDDVDGTKLADPGKGRKAKRIEVVDLREGDHIYVGAYGFENMEKNKRTRLKEYGRNKLHLWKHHFLIGEFDHTVRDTDTVFKRVFRIYEFTGDGSGKALTEKRNADTRDFWVTATKQRDKDGNGRWEYVQSNQRHDFKRYVKRGLNRWSHDTYNNQRIEEVLHRARIACRKDFRGKYNALHMNCEHFVTFCKGLSKYGYCYMFKTHARELFVEDWELSGQQPQGDVEERATLPGDRQVTDHDEDDDDDDELYFDFDLENKEIKAIVDAN